LANVRKVEIVVEFVCNPYFPSFDPAVVRRIVLNKVGVLAIFKIKSDVFKKSGLVIFDSEVVMGMTIPYQIVSDILLSQEGISRNFFTLNIDGVK